MNLKFSEETWLWLAGWLSGGKEIKKLPEKIKEEILEKTNEDLLLYRGVLKSDLFEVDGDNVFIIFDNMPSSWTWNKEVAKRFSSEVVITKVDRKNVLIDTTMLTKEFMNSMGGFPDELEVILLPGKFLTNLHPNQIKFKNKLNQ